MRTYKSTALVIEQPSRAKSPPANMMCSSSTLKSVPDDVVNVTSDNKPRNA